jgi:hypothetical protein
MADDPRRGQYSGMADLRPHFTDRTARGTHPGLRMTAVPSPPSLVLDADVRQLLYDGLGRFDMEIRWLAHLDESNVLRALAFLDRTADLPGHR